MVSHARLGAAILSLLACNTVYYIAAGRASEALESVAWYALLILFMLETARAQQPRSARALITIHGLRLLATLAIAVSAALYVREQEWLDATNLLLWISVVVLLEIEVQRPAVVISHREIFTGVAALLYSALGVLVVIWLLRGEWIDAWDAALWLGAFAILELNLLRTTTK